MLYRLINTLAQTDPSSWLSFVADLTTAGMLIVAFGYYFRVIRPAEQKATHEHVDSLMAVMQAERQADRESDILSREAQERQTIAVLEAFAQGRKE